MVEKAPCRSRGIRTGTVTKSKLHAFTVTASKFGESRKNGALVQYIFETCRGTEVDETKSLSTKILIDCEFLAC